MSDPTLEQLTAKYSLTENEVKRLRGMSFADSLDAPIATQFFGTVIRIADDWRFEKWLKRVREASSN